MVAARVMPAWRHMPSKHAVVAGQRPGVARRRPLPAGGGAALHEHERLAGRDGAGALEEGAPVGHALDVGERHVGGGVVGVVLEVVGDGDGGGVAGATPPGSRRRRSARRSSGTTRRSCPTGWRCRCRPAGGYGATICAHRCGGRGHHALAVRAGDEHPELVGQRDQLGLQPLALARRPRRSRPTRGTRPGCPSWRRPGAGRGWPAAGVHTKTRSIASSGSSAMSATTSTPSTSPGSRLVP